MTTAVMFDEGVALSQTHQCSTLTSTSMFRTYTYIYVYQAVTIGLIYPLGFLLASSHSILIRTSKMQQYAGIYLLQVYSTCFGRPSRPSSGVQKTVTAASGTSTFLQYGLIRP